MPANEALRIALERAGVSQTALAERLDVSRNTVGDWVNNGTRTTPARQAAVVQVLNEAIAERYDSDQDYALSVEDLWPLEITPGEALEEFVAAWGGRAEVPPELWARLAQPPRTGGLQVDVSGFATTVLLEVDPSHFARLAGIAALGGAIRICIAHPDSEQVAARDAEEETNGTLRGRVVEALHRYRSALLGIDGAEIRLHRAPLYCATFRYGDSMVVTEHLFGLTGTEAPTALLHRESSAGWFDKYAAHFERLWKSASPISEFLDPK